MERTARRALDRCHRSHRARRHRLGSALVRAGPEGLRRMQKGFTYLTVLFVLAMMSGGLALIGEVWQTANVREKEAELLHIGNEYRKAIERYYVAGNSRQYPKNISDLVKDPRQPGTVRHLRRIYPDPI